MKRVTVLIVITAIIYILSAIFAPAGSIIEVTCRESNPATSDTIDFIPMNFKQMYDIIVVGGEPEGVAAAVCAARNGMQTLLVEKRPGLGGLLTYGMLNYLDISYGIDHQPSTRGIFEEWHQMVGGQNAFDIGRGKQAFWDLVLAEPHLTLALDTNLIETILSSDGKRLTGIVLKNKYGTFRVYARAFIDATQNADLAVKAGAPFFIGGEDIGLGNRKMAATLIIHLQGVDWEGIKETARSRKFGPAFFKEEAGSGKEQPMVAWGFGKLAEIYRPIEEKTRLRGLNIARVGDDYYINGLQIFGVDGLDEASRREAMERGRRETINILKFLQNNFPGFQKARIAGFPSELYIRETRHIICEYQLPLSDLWENRDHYDGIAYGAYPVDIQAQTIHDLGYVICDPVQYAIPLRSLIPKHPSGLLVVGRSAGYSSLAAGSTRVVPTGMGTGQAAGTAAALAVKNKITFKEMVEEEQYISELRGTLKEQGAAVDHFHIGFPYQGEWFYPGLKILLNYGLVCGGYHNELQVNSYADTRMFVNLLGQAIRRSNQQLYQKNLQKITNLYHEVYSREKTPLTRDRAAEIITEAVIECRDVTNPWNFLLKTGLIDERLAEKLKADRILKRMEVYYLLGILVDKFKKQTNFLNKGHHHLSSVGL